MSGRRRVSGMAVLGSGLVHGSLRMRSLSDVEGCVINGMETLIPNGILCALCGVAAKTVPEPEIRLRDIRLVAIEAGA